MNEPTAWVMSATILRSLYDIAAAATATTVASWKSSLETGSLPAADCSRMKRPTLARGRGRGGRAVGARGGVGPATTAAIARDSERATGDAAAAAAVTRTAGARAGARQREPWASRGSLDGRGSDRGRIAEGQRRDSRRRASRRGIVRRARRVERRASARASRA